MPSDDTRTTHARVAGAPEDLKLKPQDLQLFPEEIGADLDEWTEIPITNPEGASVFYWDTHSLQTSILDA